MSLINIKDLNKLIQSVAQAERVTKADLSVFSRMSLGYTLINGAKNAESGEEQGSFDIQPINRMISVLTPMNKRTAVLFFDHFLPFSFDEEQGKFVAGINKKQRNDKVVQAIAFLEMPDNDIWKWATENVRIEKKPTDYAKNIKHWVHKALDDDESTLTPADVFSAVLEGGLSVDDIQAVLAAMVASESEQ